MRWLRWVVVLATVGALAACDGNPGTSGPLAGSSAPELPAPSSPAGLGPAVRIPYWADGKLHLDGRAFDRPRPRSILYRAPTVVLAWAYPDEAPRAWWVARTRGDRFWLDRLPTAAEPQDPVLSADGRLIAWIDKQHELRRVGEGFLADYRVNLYDVRRDRVVGRLLRTHELIPREKCCDLLGQLTASGVTNDGRVVLSTRGRGQEVWRPGSDPVRLDRRLDILGVPMWPPGIGYTPDTRSKERYPAAFARVGARGGVRPVGWVYPSSGQWNRSGTLFAFTDYDADTAGVALFVDGRRQAANLDLPAPYGIRWGFVGWEDDEHIVVDRTEFLEDGWVTDFARCDATSATCQHVTDPRAGVDVVLPTT